MIFRLRRRERALRKRLLKAGAVTDATGMPAISDSGLMVDALGGAPGIYSARFGGESCKNDADRIALLLKKQKRGTGSARFVSCIACTFPNGDICARSECEEILTAPRGENGFGCDSVSDPGA